MARSAQTKANRHPITTPSLEDLVLTPESDPTKDKIELLRHVPQLGGRSLPIEPTG